MAAAVVEAAATSPQPVGAGVVGAGAEAPQAGAVVAAGAATKDAGVVPFEASLV